LMDYSGIYEAFIHSDGSGAITVDKPWYKVADDSKVLHSTVTDLKSTDMNTVITAGFYMLRSGTNGIPSGDDHTIYQVIPYYSSNGVQLAYGTNGVVLGMRSWNNYNHFTSWVQFADDSKVAHLSGANNFDTVPTVNNNPLLLASSLPSDLARTGSNQEFTGKNTFDVAPIDKITGNPYITKDGVPNDVARTGQTNTFNLLQTFSQGVKTLQTGSYDDVNSLVNEGLYFNTNLSIKNGAGSITAGFIQVISGYWDRVRQFMYSDVTNNLIYTRVSSDSGSTWSDWESLATTDDVTTAISTATANMVDSTKATNFTAGLQTSGFDVLGAKTLSSSDDYLKQSNDNPNVLFIVKG